MSSIKLTPMILFLILLIVLVISVMYGNQLLVKEGFVSFQTNSKPLEIVKIPSYSSSNPSVKLYDNIYFDNKNGNVIEVDSTTYSGNVDSTGITISTTRVIPRNDSGSSGKIYKNTVTNGTVIPQDIPQSLIASVPYSYSSYLYETQSTNTDKYSVFYLPWKTDTYIHILDNTLSSQLASYYFDNNNNMQIYNYSKNNIGLTSYVPFVPVSNITTLDKFYDGNASLYQISQYVKYDIANGNLIVQNTPDGNGKTITVYNRNGASQSVSSAGQYQNTNKSITTVLFAPFNVIDTLGQNLILYLACKSNTVIALISYKDSSKTSFVLNNCVRFTATTVDLGTTQPPAMNSPNGSGNMNLPLAPPMLDSAVSEYFKWYWYWNSTGKSTNMNYSDDYLLKTQVVPPVCPACPSCSGGGVCSNCGGQGGSGTIAQNGNTVVGGSNIYNMRYDTPGQSGAKSSGQTTSPTTNQNVSVIGNGGFVSNADPNTVGGSLTLATYDTVAGVEGVAKTGADVVNTAVGTVGSVANTAIGAVGNVASDVTGLVGGAGTGLKDILTQDKQSNLNNKYGQDNRPIIGPNGKPITINRTEGAFHSPYGTSSIDQYSYYGKLPSKGDSNYMPITADFSKFGR